MPRGPKGEKRPADAIGNAVHATRPQQNRTMMMDGLEVEMANNTIATAVAKNSSPK
jgi:hypothetical protein